MSILAGIRRFFFQKASTDFDANEAFRRNQTRYNALYALDPDVLVRHLAAFNRGDICGLERVLEEFEAREDKMRIGAFKMAAAVSSKPWEVRAVRGEEDNPRAKLHRDTLTRFWNRIEVTDAFCRNRKGGLRLLAKQMMEAQSRVYSVHDIAWRVNGDGTLDAVFTHVPAWCFENRTGRLRYIRNDGDTLGEEMRDGEWLVTVGEGVGIAAAILAMAKRLSWNDWLLFSEKCGMPVVMGNTSAQKGSPAWDALARAIKAVAPKTGILADSGTQLNAVSMGAGGQGTYREMVETVDRAISALYRGGDLATVSSDPSAAGVNAQQGESELMDADGCSLVAETLRDQVEKFVVRFVCGDFEPLAGIVFNPPAETLDTEREIRIDQHLAGLGVRLSKADALARYGRIEAKDDADALKPSSAPPQSGGPGAGGLWNERTLGGKPLQGVAGPLQNARDGEGATTGRPGEKPPSAGIVAPPAPDEGATHLARAMQRDLRPAGKIIAEALRTGDWATVRKKLAGALKECGTESAAVLEEEMARAGAEGLGGGKATKGRNDETTKGEDAALANEQARVPSGNGNGGQFAGETNPPDGKTAEDQGESPRDKADKQAQKLGYKNRNDLLVQADKVSKERVAELVEGGKSRCKAHEAIAVLRSNPTMKDTAGREIQFSDELIGHYVYGQRREGNTPKVGNLCDLPLAIHAVRHDRHPELKFKRGAIHDPMHPPRGTQREYKTETGSGQLHAYAYVDSGKIQGWHVK